MDMCPQANLSEITLGGQQSHGGHNLLRCQAKIPRCSIGGYFNIRLTSPFSTPVFNARDFITSASKYNASIPENIDIVCGDNLLELQSMAINNLANTVLPGINTWARIIGWVKNFLDQLDYDYVFFDTNPSFSIYTQMALAASSRVILPITADSSSRVAIKNAMSLIYGIKLPSDEYLKYTFANKMNDSNQSLPKIHLILKNRLTQYMGEGTAYHTVLSGVDRDVEDLLNQYPQYFTFTNTNEGTVNIRDFGNTGVVSFAKGCAFSTMPTGKLTISGQRVQVNPEQKNQAIASVDLIVGKLK